MTAPDTKAAPTIEELEAKLAIATEARRKRASDANEQVRRKRLEEELVLAEIEPELGVLGKDFDAVFSSRTGEMVVVRAPTVAAHGRFRTKMLKGRVNEVDMYEHVHACLVHPDKKTFEQVLERTPSMLEVAITVITRLGGDKEEALSGK